MFANRESKKGLGKKRGTRWPLFLWSLTVSVIILALFALPGVTWSLVVHRILWPLVRLLFIMSVSLGLSAVVEGMGWSRFVASLARPIMRLGNLSDWSGTAFTTAFLSGVAANTLLWNAYQDGKISRREMMLASLMNLGLPSYVLHLPVTFAIIVPLVGSAGLIYMTLTFLAAVFRTLVVLVAGRLFLARAQESLAQGDMLQVGSVPDDRDKGQRISHLLGLYLSDRLVRIAMYTVPIYMLVVLLQEWGFFTWLQGAATSLIRLRAFPVEGISVVVFSIVAEFTAGAAAAGAMLREGVLTVKETVLALIMGNIIATPVRALRHQLPKYLGIYRPKTGIQLLLAGQALRIISVLLVGSIYYFLV